MTLRELMNEDTRKIVKINLDEIDKNDNNFYETNAQEDFSAKVQALKQSIMKNGLIEPISVCKNSNGRFTIISGHTRFIAMCELSEEGKKDGTIECMIDNEIDTDTQISRLIESNIQRTKNEKVIKIEMEYAEKEYQKLVDSGNRPSGSKDEWIAKLLGISDRTVRRRRNSINNSSNNTSSTSSSTDEQSDDEKLQKLLKSTLNNLKKLNNYACNDSTFMTSEEYIHMTKLIEILQTKMD